MMMPLGCATSCLRIVSLQGARFLRLSALTFPTPRDARNAAQQSLLRPSSVSVIVYLQRPNHSPEPTPGAGFSLSLGGFTVWVLRGVPQLLSLGRLPLWNLPK